MSADNRTLRAKSGKSKMMAGIAAATVMFGLSRGLSIKQIRSATGLTLKHLVNPEARVSETVVPNIWQLLDEAHPDEALSLGMARAAPLSLFGTVLHSAQFAENLRAAIGFIVRNRTVFADSFHLELFEHEDLATLRAWHPLDELDRGRTAEFGMALGWRLISEVLRQDNCLVRVEFSHKPFGPLDQYRGFFGADVLFAQPHNALIIERSALDNPARQSDKNLFAYAERMLDGTRRRLALSKPRAELVKVREAIAHNSARGIYDAGAIARDANMSLRAAQRLASDHDLSLSELIAEARANQAKKLLQDPRVSIDWVAQQVGYSDDRAFRRAFARWTGHSPAEYRRDLVS